MKMPGLALGLVAAAVLRAAAADTAVAPAASPGDSAVQLVFPKPPDKPRIRFVRSIANMRDLKGRKPTFFERLLAFLSGADADRPLFNNPYGVWLQGSRLYVADTSGQQLVVVDLKTAAVRRLGEKLEGGIRVPVGLAVDDDGTVYATDTGDHSVKAYSADGRFLWRTDGLSAEAGSLNRPAGIAVTPAGELLVADSGNRRLVLLSKEGRFLKELCNNNKQEAYALPNPNHVWAEKGGAFLVSDPFAMRVHVFSSTGGYVSGFGQPGDSPGYMARPRGVAVDSDGNIHVVDAVFSRVQVFDRDGRLLVWYAAPGSGPAQLALPAGIFIDKEDTIYIADSKVRRVQVFQYITYPEEKAAAAPASSQEGKE